MGYYNKFNVLGGTTIIVNTGGVGEIKFINNDFWCSDGSFYISNLKEFNNKFFYYYLLKYEEYIKSKKRIGGVPTIDKKVIENIKIPKISLEKQKEIVKILDKFDTLVNDLSEGIPAEIEMRTKQYEYYRNKLLTFEEE